MLGNTIVIYVLVTSLCVNRHIQSLNNEQTVYTKSNLANKSSIPLQPMSSAQAMAPPNLHAFNNSFKSLTKRRGDENNFKEQKSQNTLKVNNNQNEFEIDDLQCPKTEEKKPGCLDNKRKSVITLAHQTNQNDFDSKKSIKSQFQALMHRFLKEKLTVTNFYLLNLAISDFFYISFIPFLLFTMLKNQWIFGEFWCKIYFSVNYLCQFFTALILVILSIDRYLSVKYAFKVTNFRSDIKARIIIAICWPLAIIFVIPVIFVTKMQTETCSLVWPKSWNFTGLTDTNATIFMDKNLPPLQAFTMYTFIFNYLIPVVIIVILYSRMLLFLRKKNQLNTIKQSKFKKKSNRRITKMVLAIIICYILSWSPYWFTQFFQFIYFHLLGKGYPLFFTFIAHFVQICAYMSSTINPFIYSYMSEAFRNDLKTAFDNFCFNISLRQSFNSFNKRENGNKIQSKNLKALPTVENTANEVLENHNENIIITRSDENTVKTENLLSKEKNSKRESSTMKSSETRKFAFNPTNSKPIFTFEIDFHGLNFFKRNQFRK